jgi:uncharacterized protein YgbK (DUF1537 family)
MEWMTMTGANDLLLCYYGDDFTGSTDALECLTLAGAHTALFIEPPTPDRLARYTGLRAVGVAGMTRSLPPDDMEAELRPALAALRALGAPHVHYKVCSTFDSSPTVGSIGRAMDVAAGVFDALFIPLLVGAPALGRYCVFGNLFARCGGGGPAYRLDRHPSMSRHPITPADESDLRPHLARQTSKRVGLFDVLQLALPPADARAALEALLGEGPEVVLFDVLSPDQLGRIGWLIDAYADRRRPLFSVGSSGVESALGAHWVAEKRLTPADRFPNPGRAEPLLVASGSCSPVTGRQMAWALARGMVEVRLDTQALAAGHDAEAIVRRAAEATVGHLQAGRSVIVHTSTGGDDARVAAAADSARLFGTALGRVVRSAVGEGGVRRLCVAGGDTSSYLARALGIEAVEMIGPIVPGAPLCRAHAPGSPADGLEVNFKGGQVGGTDYFEVVARGKP